MHPCCRLPLILPVHREAWRWRREAPQQVLGLLHLNLRGAGEADEGGEAEAAVVVVVGQLVLQGLR